MGDRLANIERAIKLIGDTDGIEILKISYLYETEPVGYEDQDCFYNICLLIATELGPHDLLKAVRKVEQKLHRKRIIRWGPRTMDVDIITYGDETVDDEDLTVPHPRYLERAFVLVPMNDIGKYDGEVPDGKSVKRVEGMFRDGRFEV